MLVNAVNSFYQSGHKEYAQKIYNQLRKLYPLDEFKDPLVANFVKKRLYEELETIVINDAKEIIITMLRESYYLYAIYDDDAAFGREKMAEDVFQYYQTKYDDTQRIDLPDLKLLRYFALSDFLNDQQYLPHLRQSLLNRIKIERPELYKQLEAEAEKLKKQTEKQQ
jgi:hypothetical protein